MSEDWDYAKHTKEVSEHGGPDQYDKDLIHQGRFEGGAITGILIFGIYGIYKGGQKIYSKFNQWHNNKIEEIKKKNDPQKEKPEN